MSNILTPETSIRSFSPIHKAVEIEIKISPTPDDREVYETRNSAALPANWIARANLTETQSQKWLDTYQGKKWIDTVAISNTGLLKIMNAIDAEVVRNERVDPRTIPHYCEWSFSVSYTKPDGSKGVLSGDYAMDLRLPNDIDGGGARYQELLMTNQDKLTFEEAKKRNLNRQQKERWDAFIERVWLSLPEETQVKIQEQSASRAERAVIKMRPFLIQRAQTGARNRAVRSLGIRSWYFPHELEHPLVIQRVELDWGRAIEHLGSDQTKALLLGLVERQFGVPASEIKALAAPAPQVVEESAVEEMEEAIEEVVAEVAEEVAEPESTVEETPPQIEALDLREVYDLKFDTTYEEMKEQLTLERVQNWVGKHILGMLVDAGYENKQHRKNLLNNLFGSSDFKDYCVGFFRLLEQYAASVIENGNKEYAKKVVKIGVERQLDWAGAVEWLGYSEEIDIPF